MPVIETRRGEKILVDPEDCCVYNVVCWRVGNDGLVKHNYRTGSKVTSVTLARLIMDAPADKRVRYKNGDKLDCRKANLFLVNGTEHKLMCAKPHSSETSEYRGVSRDRTTPRTLPYRASLKVSGEQVCIGYFRTPEAAASGYDSFVRGCLGPAAYTNFPQS